MTTYGYRIDLRFASKIGEPQFSAIVHNTEKPDTASVTLDGRTIPSLLAKVADMINRKEHERWKDTTKVSKILNLTSR
jgi:hypothetical protein